MQFIISSFIPCGHLQLAPTEWSTLPNYYCCVLHGLRGWMFGARESQRRINWGISNGRAVHNKQIIMYWRLNCFRCGSRVTYWSFQWAVKILYPWTEGSFQRSYHVSSSAAWVALFEQRNCLHWHNTTNHCYRKCFVAVLFSLMVVYP